MSIYTPEPILSAILGPTNTGKTHYAVERMLGRNSGVIGLPLRLLAREVYDRIVRVKGKNACALITGEEKIIPKHASYYVCTVEAMPTTRRFAFVCVDEVQLAAHPERGHIFTDRLLNMRGTEETLFLGAEAIRPVIRDLVPKMRHETRERFSTLTFAGHSKLTRLPKRSVIVAFSASEVYRLAELMRRYRGGAAVVMGALSPRTRNAQAELYQSGEVDFLIATDAVGMGLNLDADNVAFASLRKFDGRRKRFLTPMEAAQIAGRAGRFRNNGTFGTAGGCQPMDEDLVGRIENHIFEPYRGVEWRNSNLDTSTLSSLFDTLTRPCPHKRLRRAQNSIDEAALERLSSDNFIADTLSDQSAVSRLWEVCQIPDFRDMGLDAHLRLLSDIYKTLLANQGKLPDSWLMRHVARLDHLDGTIDTLSARLMHIRTWTYVSNKANWLVDGDNWRRKTRLIEDTLSDALHARLIDRFVDRRTRALMKGLGEKALMDVNINADGVIKAEGHIIGQLTGLKFKVDENASGLEAKALHNAAMEVAGPEVDRRMTAMIGATHDVFTLTPEGRIKWGDAEVAQLSPGRSLLHPVVDVIGGDFGQSLLRDQLTARLNDYIQTEIRTKLAPLKHLETLMTSKDIVGEARGFAFRMFELNGLMPRKGHEAEIRALETKTRADLRGAGIRFGEYYLFMPDLIKPAASTLLSVLTAFGTGGDKKPFTPFAGVTSIAMETGYSEAAFNAAGYSGRGGRIVRVDILNRLGDTIRQAKKESGSAKFYISMEMMALLGSSFEECKEVLRALGYKSEPSDKPMPEPKPEPESQSNDAPYQEGQVPAQSDFDSAMNLTNAAPVGQTGALASAPDPAETPQAGAATLNTIGKDGKPKHAMPKSPKQNKKKSSKSEPRPLSYYWPVTGQDETGADIRSTQSEIWYMPFRRSANRGGKRGYQGEQNKSNGKAGFKGKKSAQRDGRKNVNPKNNKYKTRETRRMEDSPFAALAALKTPKKD